MIARACGGDCSAGDRARPAGANNGVLAEAAAPGGLSLPLPSFPVNQPLAMALWTRPITVEQLNALGAKIEVFRD